MAGGLKARRNANAGTAAGTATQETAVQETVAQETAATTAAAPAVRTAAAPVASAKPGELQNLNAGVLDNIDDLDVGGNYVSIDGSEFLYKDSNETAKEIDMVVSYGKRFYQWYDEPNEKYHNSDTKIDDRYKFKFEIRWFEENEDGEPVEYTMSLPTASAISFTNYLKALAKQGKAINQVVTRMTLSRQVSRDGNNRYSRVEFENAGDVA